MAEISVRSVQVGRILDAYYLKMRISSVDGGVAAPDVRIHETHTELTPVQYMGVSFDFGAHLEHFLFSSLFLLPVLFSV